MRIFNKFFTKPVRTEQITYLENLAKQARQSRERRPTSSR